MKNPTGKSSNSTRRCFLQPRSTQNLLHLQCLFYFLAIFLMQLSILSTFVILYTQHYILNRFLYCSLKSEWPYSHVKFEICIFNMCSVRRIAFAFEKCTADYWKSNAFPWTSWSMGCFFPQRVMFETLNPPLAGTQTHWLKTTAVTENPPRTIYVFLYIRLYKVVLYCFHRVSFYMKINFRTDQRHVCFLMAV